MLPETKKQTSVIKEIFSTIGTFAAKTFKAVAAWPVWSVLREQLRWKNLRPKLETVCSAVKTFTKEQPRTAAFIYVCLFCSFSIAFLDAPLADAVLNRDRNRFLLILEDINPSGWWFLILSAVWLFFTVKAGLSLTTESFERSLANARMTAFILLTVAVSSAVTIFLNILIGRYTPYFMIKMDITGFSPFRFRLSEISFPSFGAQSIWAVACAAGHVLPKLKKAFYAAACVESAALPLTGMCFLSDAVFGAYIGVVMFSVARWIVSEERGNDPIFTR